MPGSRARAFGVIASLFGGGLLFCSGLAVADEQPSAEQAERMMDDLMYGRGTVGGPFTLTDPAGKRDRKSVV